MTKKVVLECDPDEILVKALGIGKREISHQSGKGEVCNYFSKEPTKVALIDEDPGSGQPKHLNEFTFFEERYRIKKLIHKTLHTDEDSKIILILKPRLEEWILYQCEQSEVDPKEFHLSNEPKRLKDTINLRLNHFELLINELIKKKNKGILYIKNEIEKCYE